MSTMLRVLIWLLAATTCFHCTRNSEEAQNRQRIDARSHPLTFDYEKVNEIEINRFNPEKGESWSLRASKISAKVGPRAARWKIEPYLDGSQFVDREANGKFIEHLLDTFQTLEVLSIAPPANEKTYGLNPAHFELRWPSKDRVYEVRLGAPISPGQEERYAEFPTIAPGIYVVRGAALKMLAYIEGAKTFRLEQWIPLDTSQVRSFSLKRAQETPFDAKRVSGKWVGKTNVTTDEVQAFLEQLLHLRVADFVDSAPLVKSLIEKADSSSTYLINLWDRRSNLTQAKVFKSGKSYYGTVSTRPEAVFVLPPHVSRYFSPPKSK